MKRFLAVIVAMGVTTPSMAIDDEDAAAWLVGTWEHQWLAETWIFDEAGTWSQFVGGTHYETTFQTESMPANLFGLHSDASGKLYVVHKRGEDSFSIAEHGSERSFGAFSRSK